MLRSQSLWASGSGLQRPRAFVAALSVVLAFGLFAVSVASAFGGLSAPKPIDPSHRLDSVSCATESFCATVDSAGSALIYEGGSWGGPTNLGSAALSSISCVSSACTTVDNAGNVFRRASGAWGGATDINGSSLTPEIVSVSCASGAACVAVSPTSFSTFNGIGWKTFTAFDSNGNLTSLSCASPTFCEAVDKSGNAFIFNGSSFSGQKIDAEQNGALTSVSCSGTFCVAVDGIGNALMTSNGTTWMPPMGIDSSRKLNSVSCATSSFCTAVDQAGNALTFNGSSWSAPVNIDPGRGLTSVSCPQASFCVAVDEAGNALTFPESQAEIEAEATVKRGQEAAAQAPAKVAGPVGAPSSRALAACLSSATKAFKKSAERAKRHSGKARAKALKAARHHRGKRLAACRKRL